MTVIVDTNVPLVANRSSHASEDCVEICVDRLVQITDGEVKLAVDYQALEDRRGIIEEYRNKLDPSGQPGVGDAFLKWVEINWTNDDCCDRVEITPIAGQKINFAEFPKDPALANFHDDDRKFVAVACAHSGKPPILQAVDSKWYNFLGALSQNGVTVDYLCPGDMQNSDEA